MKIKFMIYGLGIIVISLLPILQIGCSRERNHSNLLANSTENLINITPSEQNETGQVVTAQNFTQTPVPSPTFHFDESIDLLDFKAVIIFGSSEGISLVELPCDGENQCQKNIINISKEFSDWNHIEEFSLSPAGEDFVFGSFDYSPNRINDMYLANLLDQTVLRLSQTNNEWESDFSWSPDGKWIVFSSRQDQKPRGWSATLNVIGSDGCCFRQLPGVGNRNLAPRWSPDGQYIAFLSGDWDYHLYILNVTTNEIHTVSSTHTLYEAWEFTWSPDGSRIAFVSMDQEDQNVCIVDIDPLETTCIASDPKLWESNPSWSPDGNKLLYSGFDPINKSHSIYLIDSDGSDNYRITSNDYGNPRWLGNSGYFLSTKRTGEYFNQIVLMSIYNDQEQVLITDESSISIIDLVQLNP